MSTISAIYGSQINLWRRGRKHVAVFDEELPVRPRRGAEFNNELTGLASITSSIQYKSEDIRSVQDGPGSTFLSDPLS